MTSCLIVNADDYGRTRGVSRGIREAHQQGIVTSSTVLVNLPDAIADLQQAGQETPQLAFGLHLNLTLGTPILPAERIPSLVTPKGLFPGRDLLFQRVRSVNPEDVEDEWRAQIEFMLSAFGRPDHLDSHHHVALLSPEIWGVCLQLAKEFNCPVRSPIPGDLAQTELEAFLPPASVEFVRETAVTQLAESGVPSPDLFLAGFFGEGATRARLESRLRQARSGVTELMCHPGYSGGFLAETSGYSLQREHELRLLSEPAIRETIRAAGWTLTSYGELWKSALDA